LITTSSLTIIQILGDVYNRRIRIPDFQRSSVWGPDDVAKLLDSIYKGYPLGSFLLWETSDELRERNPLNLSPPPPRPERQYLIDGQQRTIALWGVFTDTLRLGDEKEQKQYRAYFDLDSQIDRCPEIGLKWFLFTFHDLRKALGFVSVLDFFE